ncbi:hypothetical protein HDK90DRAFT_354478 [Phyllosticta capitalensis]|uniref:Uncharacterized protein n=1 Tax=Phyllosticta capitalensis TaxID=121624 RepID=A0ABR1YH43_9PEZI
MHCFHEKRSARLQVVFQGLRGTRSDHEQRFRRAIFPAAYFLAPSIIEVTGLSPCFTSPSGAAMTKLTGASVRWLAYTAAYRYTALASCARGGSGAFRAGWLCGAVWLEWRLETGERFDRSGVFRLLIPWRRLVFISRRMPTRSIRALTLEWATTWDHAMVEFFFHHQLLCPVYWISFVSTGTAMLTDPPPRGQQRLSQPSLASPRLNTHARAARLSARGVRRAAVPDR